MSNSNEPVAVEGAMETTPEKPLNSDEYPAITPEAAEKIETDFDAGGSSVDGNPTPVSPVPASTESGGCNFPDSDSSTHEQLIMLLVTAGILVNSKSDVHKKTVK